MDGPVYRIVTSSWFGPATGTLIILNVILIGVETDYMARSWTTELPPVLIALDLAFCLFFCVEIALRSWVLGCSFFLHHDWYWNLFDVIMVALQVFEVSLLIILMLRPSWVVSYASRQWMMLRITRSIRLLRLFRFFKLLKTFTGLRMMIVSISDSMKSLMWSILLIVFVIFAAGVYLTQLVTNEKIARREEPEDYREIQMYFGSLSVSMLSLYEVMSEGIHWHEVMSPLSHHCSPWLALFFSLYMAFVLFAMLNVITGVFVESAMEVAKEDRRQNLMREMLQLLSTNKEIVMSDTIRREEFLMLVNTPQMERFLQAVDLDIDEAIDVFTILDVQHEGEIRTRDFVNGCMRMYGTAKAIDLAAFTHEWKATQEECFDQMLKLDQGIRAIYERLVVTPAAQGKTGPEGGWKEKQANTLRLDEA